VAQGSSCSSSQKHVDHRWEKGFVQAVKEIPFDQSDPSGSEGPDEDKRPMTNGKSHRIFLALVALFVCGVVITLLLWLPSRSKQPQPSAANDEKAKSARHLEALHEKYARVRSVHMVATAKINIYQGGILEGTGTFEYWAEGNRYRTRCHTDPQLELLGDVDMAYNGSRFYYFDRQAGMLSHRVEDEQKTFAALPNPFFLPVDFFTNDRDECAFCALRLKDFQMRTTRWDKRKDKISIRSSGKDQVTQSDLIEVEMPGEVVDKKDTKFRLHLTANANGIAHATKIERLQLDDRPLSSIVSSDFISTPAGDFPRRIQVKAFDAQSTVVMQVEFYIETLEVNQPIDNSVFKIKDEEAEVVWDSDDKKFIKQRPLKKTSQ